MSAARIGGERSSAALEGRRSCPVLAASALRPLVLAARRNTWLKSNLQAPPLNDASQPEGGLNFHAKLGVKSAFDVQTHHGVLVIEAFESKLR